MLVQERDHLPSFQPYPHTLIMQNRSRNAIQILQNLLCANSKTVQGSEACWKYTIRKTAPSLTPCSQGQSLSLMDVFGFGQNVTYWPLSPYCPTEKEPRHTAATWWSRKLLKSVLSLFIFIALPMHARSLLRAKQMDQPKSLTRRRWVKMKRVSCSDVSDSLRPHGL